MEMKVIFDWKSDLALGAAVGIIILAWKVKADEAKEVLIHVINAAKESVVAKFNNRFA